MLDLKFTSEARGAEAVVARYACPCGCTPSMVYERGADIVADACCCGNHFAVGPGAGSSLTPTDGVRLESQPLRAPWGEVLQAAWLIGASVHTPAAEHDHDAEIETHSHRPWMVVDPVCGMTVEPETAHSKGLHSSHVGQDYFFCGKGCKLEFIDDPDRYLDAGYAPSM